MNRLSCRVSINAMLAVACVCLPLGGTGTAHAVVTDSSLIGWYDARDETLNGVARGAGTQWQDRAGDDNDATIYGDAGFSSESNTALDVSDLSISAGTQDVFTFRTTLDDPTISEGRPGNVSAITANKLASNLGVGAFTVEYFGRLNLDNSAQLLIPTNATKAEGDIFTTQPRMWSTDLRDSQASHAPQMLIYGDVATDDHWNGVIAEDSAPNNQWFHYVGVFDNSQDIDPNREGDQTFAIWINGVQQDTLIVPAADFGGGTDNFTGTMNDSAGLAVIGQGVDFGNPVTQGLLDGALGFVRYYTKGLNASEITENFMDAQSFFLCSDPSCEVPVLGSFFWRADVSGDWNNAANWSTVGGSGAPVDAEAVAIFNAEDFSSSGPHTVFTDTAVTVNGVQFNQLQSYVIAGPGSVNLAPKGGGELPSISVAQGDHQFQLNVNLQADTTVDVAGGASLEFNNRFNMNGNMLTKTGDGTLMVNNNPNSGLGNVVVSSGVLGGNGAIGGDLNNNGGTVSPGNSPGAMYVAGNFSQTDDGTLLIELGGTDAGTNHDILDVEGLASLAGDLEVVLLDGYEPEAGTSFNILDFGSLLGDFDVVSLPDLSEGLSWNQSDLYANGSLSVTVVPEPAGLVLVLLVAIGMATSARRVAPHGRGK